MKKTQRWMEPLNMPVEEQDLQTVVGLTGQVAVPSRTIHGDLQDTSFLQLLHGVELIEKPNIGIRLHCMRRQKEAIYRQPQKDRFEISIPLEKENNLHTVLYTLLTHRDVIRIEDLTDALYHLEPPLITVLEEAERLAKNCDCRLRKRSDYGLSLEEHEEDIRNLFHHFVDTLPTQGYQHNDLDVHLPDVLYEEMKIVFDVQMIRMVIPAVKSSRINPDTHYCDYDFGMLILKCCILLTRCQIDRPVQKQTTISTDLQKYYVAAIMKLKMEQAFHASLPGEKIYYLKRVIPSTCKQQDQEQFQELDDAMLDRFIYLIPERLSVNPSEDRRLEQNLCNHMKPVIRGMEHGVSSESPPLEAIKTKYMEAYVAIMTTIDKIEEGEHICFDANEPGLIYLHIVRALNHSRSTCPIRCLLICDAGITFEPYIRSMAGTFSREIEIISIIGSNEMKKETEYQHDPILNTTTNRLHASGIMNTDCLFTEASCLRIRHWIFAREVKHTLGPRTEFGSYLSYFQDSCENRRNLIHKYCAYLEDDRYVTEAFGASVCGHIRYFSTTIGHGVTVPRGTKKTMENSAILVIRLDHTITRDDQFVDLIFFAAIGEDTNMEYNKTSRRIVRVVSDNEQTHMLKGCNNPEGVREYLSDTEQRA